MSFSQAEHARKKKKTRREQFLGEMEQVVPWARLIGVIEPFYPSGKRGRPPIGLERMLRIYFLQQWYALADEALEDAIYDSQAMRTFAGIDLGSEAVPDATTLLQFRHLLERHELTKRIFAEINAMLEQKKLLLREGTIIDATMIAAPSSTKNRQGRRDPEMHQAKKGEQWYFGLKAHTGDDVYSGLVHTLCVTASNVSDVTKAHVSMHGQESVVFCDAAYGGVEKRPEIVAKFPNVRFEVAAKRGKLKAMAEGALKELTLELEKLKARVRARVEHPFHIVKNLFRHRKTRYRGLAKAEAQLYSLFALANLVIAKRSLLPMARA